MVALVIGYICMRTKGIYFIMITLALTQMLYFLGISLEEYGGDDGINTDRSKFFEWFDLGDDTNLYYFILFFLVMCVWWSWRLINSKPSCRVNKPLRTSTEACQVARPKPRFK